MTAAFDGIDAMLEAPHAGIILSSIEIEFSRGEDFFVAADALATAASDAAPLAFEAR